MGCSSPLRARSGGGDSWLWKGCNCGWRPERSPLDTRRVVQDTRRGHGGASTRCNLKRGLVQAASLQAEAKLHKACSHVVGTSTVSSHPQFTHRHVLPFRWSAERPWHSPAPTSFLFQPCSFAGRELPVLAACCFLAAAPTTWLQFASKKSLISFFLPSPRILYKKGHLTHALSHKHFCGALCKQLHSPSWGPPAWSL